MYHMPCIVLHGLITYNLQLRVYCLQCRELYTKTLNHLFSCNLHLFKPKQVWFTNKHWIVFFWHTFIIIWFFFVNVLHSLLPLLLFYASRCDANAMCCNIWPILNLLWAFRHSSLGVVGKSPSQGEQYKIRPNANTPIYAYIYAYIEAYKHK